MEADKRVSVVKAEQGISVVNVLLIQRRSTSLRRRFAQGLSP